MDPTTNATTPVLHVKRHWYPVWWGVSWARHCSVGRKIAALLLLPLFLSPLIAVIIRIARQDLAPEESLLFILITLQFTWPFLLVIAPPRPKRNDRPCCAGCGQIDTTLRIVQYTAGFALFGLIPIYGIYRRPLCSLCRGLVYRIVIISQNLFAIIGFPVGTIMGIMWLVKNNKRSTINEEKSQLLREIAT
jgi:hypothetical protein